MNYWICGKKGGGKSLYAMKLLIEELGRVRTVVDKKTGNILAVNYRRPIVTNLPINYENLAEYCDKHDIDLGMHIRERVTVLEPEQLREYYRHRGRGVILPMIPHPEPETGRRGVQVADYSLRKDFGVFYIIDEVQSVFNSRAWSHTGESVMFYLQQERKLSDDSLMLTQQIKNVDRQLREGGQDYTYVRNLRKERAGLFRMPGLFMRRTFLQIPGPNEKATVTATFTLDAKGIAACYETASGVGIHGGASGADTETKTKGMHWAVGVVALVFGIWAVIHYLPRAIGYVITPKGAMVQGVQKALPFQGPQIQPVHQVSSTNALEGPLQALRARGVDDDGGEVQVTGYYRREDGCWRVCFSDGTMQVTGADKLRDNGRYVVVGSQRYKLASLGAGSGQQPAAAHMWITPAVRPYTKGARDFSESYSATH